MKKSNTSKKKSRCGLDREANRLIVQTLTQQIKWHGAKCLKQGRRILKKLNEVDQSIEIIAREIARQGKRNDE